MTFVRERANMISEHSKMKTILLVDDDEFLLNTISQSFDPQKYRVIGEFNNSLSALEFLRLNQPDVLIIDLIMPNIDGLSFLEHANKENLLEGSKVLVMSEILDDAFVTHAINLGANYYLYKPFETDLLIDRIDLLTSAADRTSVYENSIIQESISRHLLETGLPTHTLGFKYFVTALNHLIFECGEIFSITKNIYPFVAQEYKTSSSNVDKSMRHSLSLAFMHNSNHLRQFLEEMNYKDPESKPSNSEFLNLVREKVKYDLVKIH